MEPRRPGRRVSRRCTVHRSTPWRSACVMPPRRCGWRCERGATQATGSIGPMELNIPVIEGIGGSYLYLVDRYGAQEIYDVDFVAIAGAAAREQANSAGLTYIDHLTHNVHRGNMKTWADFYERVFNFREIRYFDIEGKAHRPVLQGDDQPGRQDPHSAQREPGRQIADRGIPARTTTARASSTSRSATGDIYATVDRMRARGREVPGHARLLLRGAGPARGRPRRGARSACASDRILIDGAPTEGQGLLLQIFTQNAVGPMLLRDHSAQGQRGLRRGQLQGAVRVDGARSDPPRRADARPGRRRTGMNSTVEPRLRDAELSYQDRLRQSVRQRSAARGAAASRTRRNAVPTGCTPSSCRAPHSPRRAAPIDAPGCTGSGRRRCIRRSNRPIRAASAVISRRSLTPPNQLRWDPLPIPATPADFLDGLVTAWRATAIRSCRAGCGDSPVRRQPLDGRPRASTMPTASC